MNALLRNLADGSRVVWVDLWGEFLAADGTLPKALFHDGLHPSADGYRIWLKAVMPLFGKAVRGRYGRRRGLRKNHMSFAL